MKRDIKFRAWDKQYRIMADITLIDFNTEEIDFIGNNNEPKSWEHFELMQFTGLHDKNGKEIYEGDIVNCAMIFHGKPVKPYFKSKIVYNEFIGSWQISYLNINDEFVTDTIELKYELEVIGNIYENPGLL